MRGWKECLPISHPNSSTQLWPEKQETDWEKVRGGVEEKKFKEGRFGGTATPTQTMEPGKGRNWEKARGDGVISRVERGPLERLPQKLGEGVASWGTRGKVGWRGARRTGQLGGAAPKRSWFSYLPPAWVPAVSSLASLYSAPVLLLAPQPEPRAGARGLARLSGSPPPPARWLLGRLSASVPLTIPPATPPPRARDPPLWMADTGGLCRLV